MKFETINGTLCRMVEPTPLTDDVKFPVAVEIFGKQHILKDKYQGFIPIVFAATYMDMSLHQAPFLCYLAAKIIGYPVADGSAEWALWQMEQGKKVCHKSYTMKTTHCAINDESQVVIFTTPYSVANGGDVVCHADEWLDRRQYGCGVDERTGWHLYEPQPEPKPEHPAINGYNRYDYIPVEGIRQPKPEPEQLKARIAELEAELKAYKFALENAIIDRTLGGITPLAQYVADARAELNRQAQEERCLTK